MLLVPFRRQSCSIKQPDSKGSYHSLSAASKITSIESKESTHQQNQIDTETPIQAITFIIGGIFAFCLVNGGAIYLYSRYKK